MLLEPMLHDKNSLFQRACSLLIRLNYFCIYLFLLSVNELVLYIVSASWNTLTMEPASSLGIPLFLYPSMWSERPLLLLPLWLSTIGSRVLRWSPWVFWVTSPHRLSISLLSSSSLLMGASIGSACWDAAASWQLLILISQEAWYHSLVLRVVNGFTCYVDRLCWSPRQQVLAQHPGSVLPIPLARWVL